MEFESRRRQPPVINLSALIDIAFILVIFIVLAANFDRIREIEVNLPDASSPATANRESLVVTVPQKGPLKIEGRLVEQAAIGSELAKLKDKYQSILLLADQAASVQRAVKVLADAQKAGFKSVGIATRQAQ